MLRTQKRNVYTIEKGGVRKLIYQSPWYEDGRFAGIVEIALEVPESMPHFARDASLISPPAPPTAPPAGA